MELKNEQIGQRLAELRKVLSQDTGVKWSQPKLAQELNVTQTVIARMEKGDGAIDNLIKLLLFYHYNGFNMQWVVVPDNENIPKYLKQLDEGFNKNPRLISALEIINEIILGKRLT